MIKFENVTKAYPDGTVAVDGLTGQRLKSDLGEVREPVWGPFAQQ